MQSPAHSYDENKVIWKIRKSSENHNDLYKKKMRRDNAAHKGRWISPLINLQS